MVNLFPDNDMTFKQQQLGYPLTHRSHSVITLPVHVEEQSVAVGED